MDRLTTGDMTIEFDTWRRSLNRKAFPSLHWRDDRRSDIRFAWFEMAVDRGHANLRPFHHVHQSLFRTLPVHTCPGVDVWHWEYDAVGRSQFACMELVAKLSKQVLSHNFCRIPVV